MRISLKKYGSINIVMKKPILNGKTDTITKMGTGLFNSNVLLEASPKKSIMASKFSQAVENGGFSDVLAFSHEKNGENSPKKAKNIVNDLHKQAIINSYNNKDNGKKDFDTIPDENCQIINEWEQKKNGISKKTPVFDRNL